VQSSTEVRDFRQSAQKGIQMSKQDDNKAVVASGSPSFGARLQSRHCRPDRSAGHAPEVFVARAARRGRDDIKAFMDDFREAFPDLNFWGTADLIAEGDYVVGQWEGGARIRGRPSRTPGRLLPQQPGARCTSPAPPCCVCRTAKSSGSVSTMASRLSRNSAF